MGSGLHRTRRNATLRARAGPGDRRGAWACGRGQQAVGGGAGRGGALTQAQHALPVRLVVPPLALVDVAIAVVHAAPPAALVGTPLTFVILFGSEKMDPIALKARRCPCSRRPPPSSQASKPRTWAASVLALLSPTFCIEKSLQAVHVPLLRLSQLPTLPFLLPSHSPGPGASNVQQLEGS